MDAAATGPGGFIQCSQRMVSIKRFDGSVYMVFQIMMPTRHNRPFPPWIPITPTDLPMSLRTLDATTLPVGVSDDGLWGSRAYVTADGAPVVQLVICTKPPGANDDDNSSVDFNDNGGGVNGHEGFNGLDRILRTGNDLDLRTMAHHINGLAAGVSAPANSALHDIRGFNVDENDVSDESDDSSIREVDAPNSINGTNGVNDTPVAIAPEALLRRIMEEEIQARVEAGIIQYIASQRPASYSEDDLHNELAGIGPFASGALAPPSEAETNGSGSQALSNGTNGHTNGQTNGETNGDGEHRWAPRHEDDDEMLG